MDEVQGSVLAAVFYPYTITQLQRPHPLFVPAMQTLSNPMHLSFCRKNYQRFHSLGCITNMVEKSD